MSLSSQFKMSYHKKFDLYNFKKSYKDILISTESQIKKKGFAYFYTYFISGYLPNESSEQLTKSYDSETGFKTLPKRYNNLYEKQLNLELKKENDFENVIINYNQKNGCVRHFTESHLLEYPMATKRFTAMYAINDRLHDYISKNFDNGIEELAENVENCNSKAIKQLIKFSGELSKGYIEGFFEYFLECVSFMYSYVKHRYHTFRVYDNNNLSIAFAIMLDILRPPINSEQDGFFDKIFEKYFKSSRVCSSSVVFLKTNQMLNEYYNSWLYFCVKISEDLDAETADRLFKDLIYKIGEDCIDIIQYIDEIVNQEL